MDLSHLTISELRRRIDHVAATAVDVTDGEYLDLLYAELDSRTLSTSDSVDA